MNQNKNLPLRMGLICGSILGLVVVSIGIIRYQTGMILIDDQRLSYVYWGIFTMAILFTVFRFKRQDPSSFSYKQAMKIGLTAGLVSGSMYTIYIILLNNYIDPELASKIIQFKEQTKVMVNSNLSAKDTADSIKIMQMSSGVRGLVYTFVCMTFGAIHSFLGTFITRKFNY